MWRLRGVRGEGVDYVCVAFSEIVECDFAEAVGERVGKGREAVAGIVLLGVGM